MPVLYPQTILLSSMDHVKSIKKVYHVKKIKPKTDHIKYVDVIKANKSPLTDSLSNNCRNR